MNTNQNHDDRTTPDPEHVDNLIAGMFAHADADADTPDADTTGPDIDLALPAADDQGTDTDAQGTDDQGADDLPPAAKAAREAANYRRQLRETQDELQTAQEQLQARDETIDMLRRHVAEGLVGDRLSKADALWIDGFDAGQLTNDDGAIVPEKVDARIAELRNTYGITPPMSPPRARPVPIGDRGVMGQPTGAERFAAAFERRAR